MSHFNEHTLEMAIMELFEQQGYSYVNGETIHKEQTVFNRTSVLFLSKRSSDRAKSQRAMKAEQFKALARIRNGVETIPSILRRKYQIDHMPVRGLLATKLRFGIKLAALNFKKLSAYLDSLDQCALLSANS